MNSVFKEKQVYPFWVVISIGLILAMSPIIFVDFVEENPQNILFAVFLSSAIILFLAFLFLLVNIKIRIDTDEIRFKFFPFILKESVLKWSEIKKVEIRKSKSIREFGGWGYRIGRGKRAYTLYGHWGLDLTLLNENHLFIGTQKHCELEALLKDFIYPKYPGLKPERT